MTEETHIVKRAQDEGNLKRYHYQHTTTPNFLWPERRGKKTERKTENAKVKTQLTRGNRFSSSQLRQVDEQVN